MREAAHWSNLSKVQLCAPDASGSVSVSQLNAADQVRLVNWQRALFQAELKAAAPQAIICFSGRLSWKLWHLLVASPADMGEIAFAHVGDEKRDLGVYTAPILGGVPLVATFHPNARMATARKDAHRQVVLDELKARMRH